MTRSGSRDWRGIGCAAVLAASIAFPMGLFVGARNEPARENAGGASRLGPSRGKTPTARNPYSPRVTSDPYVIEQQRQVVRALEMSCRQFKQHCAEAEQGRQRIEEAEAER